MFEVNFPESIGFVSTYLTRAWDAYMRGDDENVMFQWFDDTLLDIVTLAVKATADTEGAVIDNDAQLYRRAADWLSDVRSLLVRLAEDCEGDK